MNIFEFIVIYLSLGAAFGVYGYFNAELKYPGNLFFGIGVFFVWPAFIFRFSAVHLFRFLRIGFVEQPTSDSKTQKELQNFQKQLERSLNGKSANLPLYVWRDTISRYSGLTSAAKHNLPDTHFPLLEHTGFNPSKTQHICLQRRNAKKLSKHRTAVCNEFLDAVVEIAASNRNPEVFGLAKQLAGTLGDEFSLLELDRLEEAFSEKPEHGRNSTVENIWAHQSN